MSDLPRIKPLIIIPNGEISRRDIKRLNDNGFCVVEAKDPSKVRFADPPPGDYSAQERAAIDLFRVLADRSNSASYNRKDIATMYVELLLRAGQPTAVTGVTKANRGV